MRVMNAWQASNRSRQSTRSSQPPGDWEEVLVAQVLAAFGLASSAGLRVQPPWSR